MGQILHKDKDITILISSLKPSTEPINYNVSKFLRLHESEASRRRIANVDKFIQHLDAKIHIDTTDPRYSHIYQSIDTIVNRVMTQLTEVDIFFAEVKLRKTGSSMSGVKVGLPHESDYVLVLPPGRRLRRGKAFGSRTLFPLVKQIVAHHASALTAGLEGHWIIHGVKEYRHIGGVCLVMQHRSSANETTSKDVGVTVDLVPVHIKETTTKALNAKAEAFLQNSLAEYAAKGDIYSMVKSFHTEAINNDKCDTGFIENTIIKQLPEDTKRTFRVAKYLMSHFVASDEIPFDDIETIDKATRLRLYGCKPYISSYRLRKLFLHLLLQVQGTEAEQRLKGGLLLLCLLDIIKQCSINKVPEVFFWVDSNPLLEGERLVFRFIFPLKMLDIIKRLMEKGHAANEVEKFRLLNNIDPFYSLTGDDDTHF